MGINIDQKTWILLMAAAKAAMQEALFWSQDKTRDEIDARAEHEEHRTDLLFSDGNMDGG